MPVKFVAIKPKKLIVPAMLEGLEREAKAAAKELEKEFKETIENWKHKVKFDTEIEVDLKRVMVEVSTTDEIYGYVEEGTPPHRIEPRNAKVLAFPSIFKPKTKPGVIKSGAGFSGGPTAFSAGVNHPGTEARHFVDAIEKEFIPKFERYMDKGMEIAAEKSGHEVT